MTRRQAKRFTKRLEVTFTKDTETYRGITSDISGAGLFIRTRYALTPGVILDIEIYLPDGAISKIKGIVKRSIRTQISTIKNGMGIEIIEKDTAYTNLLKAIHPEAESDLGASTEQKSSEPDFSIIVCPGCGTKNKVKKTSEPHIPKCGKCGHPLTQQEKTSDQPEYLILACSNCKAKNKVAREKLSLNPRCGKCGTALKEEDTA